MASRVIPTNRSGPRPALFVGLITMASSSTTVKLLTPLSSLLSPNSKKVCSRGARMVFVHQVLSRPRAGMFLA